MFWGEKDTSVTFCEDKYVNSKYIAEFYNTYSGLSYCLVGLYFYNNKIKDIGVILFLLGIGTCFLHATQRYYGQLLDESCMLTLCFYIIKRLRLKQGKMTKNNILVLMLMTYFYFESIFSYFLLLFISLLIYIYLIVKKMEINKLYFEIYLNVFIISAVCWTLDQVLCEYVKKYYLHAIWHVGTSIAIFFGIKSIL